jgi:coenzyme F420-dependent glucose-6-phosphate dehydrogenase
VRLIKQLWSEQSVTFDGEYYHTKNATIYDRPEQPIPIYIGAGGPQVAKYAGRAGDGLICTSGKGMELYSEQLLPSFAAGAAESGRDAGTLDKMIEVKVSYHADRARALEDTKIWAALALPAEAKAGIDDPREMERLARGVEDVAHRRWLVSNDPDEHMEQLRPYFELGFNHMVFHSPGDDQAHFLELYGSQILPRIRSQWG